MSLSFFQKCLAAIGFATILAGLSIISRTYLRAANFELVNPFVKGLLEVVGYYEGIIIGVPLIGGFLLGAYAMWFYTQEG